MVMKILIDIYFKLNEGNKTIGHKVAFAKEQCKLDICESNLFIPTADEILMEQLIY